MRVGLATSTMFDPQYQITNKILRDTALVEAARLLIDNASLIPAWERQFQEEAQIRQTYHSTHICSIMSSFKLFI